MVAPAIPNIIRRSFPYANLTDLSFLTVQCEHQPHSSSLSLLLTLQHLIFNSNVECVMCYNVCVYVCVGGRIHLRSDQSHVHYNGGHVGPAVRTRSAQQEG
jgi:hypothetical protein